MILIAFGANIVGPYGSPQQTITAAPALLLAHGIKVKALSRQWVTAPVPASDDPWYRNAVALVETDLGPEDLMAALKETERSLGRRDFTQNAPRAMDLDLLAYHDCVSVLHNLQVPHPRLHERAFVLFPLQEVAPEWIHPALKKTAAEMIAALPPGQEAHPASDKAA